MVAGIGSELNWNADRDHPEKPVGKERSAVA